METGAREYAVLSLDVVGSLQIKQTGDPASLAETFSAYRALVDSCLQEQGSAAHCWSGDGTCALFPSVDAAFAAARSVQRGLPGFNRAMRRVGPGAIRVRAGIHTGEVPWRPGRPLGEVTSATLDMAARLQKAAQPGEVAATWEAYSRFSRRAGFLPGPRTGPLAGAYCWTEWQEQQDVPAPPPAVEKPLDPAAASRLQAELAMHSLSTTQEGTNLWARLIGGLFAAGALTLLLWLIAVGVRPAHAPSPARPASGTNVLPRESGSATPVPVGDGATSSPRAPGGSPPALPTWAQLSWTYMEASQPPAAGPVRVTETLSGAFAVGNERLARLSRSDRSRPTLLARLGPDGLAVCGLLPSGSEDRALLFSPPYHLLPHPIPVGKSQRQAFAIRLAKQQGAAEAVGTGRAALTVTDRPALRSVPAGRFLAYPFRLEEEWFAPSQGVSFRRKRVGWMAPGIGVLEENQTIQEGGASRSQRRVLAAKSF